jgi:hypothetical protein
MVARLDAGVERDQWGSIQAMAAHRRLEETLKNA